MFEEFGTVETADIITNRESGRSRGFGFVEMQDETQANAAIASLNSRDVNGRPLVVNQARPREDRQQGGDRDRGQRW